MIDPRHAAMAGAIAVAFTATVSGCLVLVEARRTGTNRRSWQLLGASLIAWAIGAALSFGSHLVDRTTVPAFGDHGVATSAYLLTSALYIAAIVLQPALAPRLVRLRTVANGVIVAASLSTVLWFAAGRRLYELTGELDAAITAIAYPAADVVLVYLVLVGVRRSRFNHPERLGAARTAGFLLAGAFTAILVGDVVDLAAGAHGFTASVPLLTETFWISGFILIAAGVRVAGDGRGRHRPVPEDDRKLVAALGLAPVVAANLAGASAAIDWIGRSTVDPPGMLMLAIVISMVLARQSVTVGDNRLLGASLQRAVEELERQATHDSLTGLPNRSGLTERVQRTIDDCVGTSRRAALLFVDLDHLKPVNDSLGHAAGDALLCTTATRLTARVGPAVTRFGGDEFVVLLHDLPALDAIASAELIGRKIVEDTARPIEISGHVIRPSVSVGIAVADAGAGPAELMRRADLALYRAKATGRRCVASYDPDGEVDARHQIDLEQELRRAIRNDEFEVHYQPVVELATGRVEGVESLLRWRHPVRGLLSPDAFLAEATTERSARERSEERTLMRACADIATSVRRQVITP
jgi:diguanylate cyclase (GGDEF)-like protein